ncbi:MAG TPA: GNAT family N-acetyltransferase, partial [Gammaproteobacteria bacterium]|nr:GNAT family N-acetyltransferase [Gammaproteobacteria bacterium]
MILKRSRCAGFRASICRSSGRPIRSRPCSVAPESFTLARLRLRRPNLKDADAMFAIGADPEVAHFADWPLSTERGAALERLRQRAEQWDAGVEYYWIITLAHDDRAIGAISTCVDRDAADVGYLLDRRQWGHGYATE